MQMTAARACAAPARACPSVFVLLNKTQGRNEKMATQKKLNDDPEIPLTKCAFDCGRMATGTLHVSFSPWLTDKQRRNFGHLFSMGMHYSLTACDECAIGAVKFKVTIPKEA